MSEKKSYTALKVIITVQFLGILGYTIATMENDGMNFFQRFYEYAISVTWAGQFTIDFGCYLLLSSIWIMWRDKFSGKSILLAIAAGIMGVLVFMPYLLYLLWKTKGDMHLFFLGERNH